ISKPCLLSQSPKNRRSWKTLSAASAAAPADWHAIARLQPLPLLYRKTRPLRGGSAKFPPKRENIPAPAGNGPPLGRFQGSRPLAFSRLPPGTNWNPQRISLPFLFLLLDE